MESLKELYKIGTGPSSSHTMGPKKAAEAFVKRASDADRYKVTLYGSLAATGKGHMTDVAILSVLEPVAPTEIVWRPDISLPFHPNGMRFEAFKAGNPWTMGDLQRRRGRSGQRGNRQESSCQHLSHDPYFRDSGVVQPRGANLLGVCRRVRRPRNLGLSR